MNAAQKRAKEAEKAMMSIARQLDKSMTRDEAHRSSELVGIIQGMKGLAKKVGIPCSCEVRGGLDIKNLKATTATSCICAATAKELRQKYLKRQAGLKRKYLDSVVVHQFEGRT